MTWLYLVRGVRSVRSLHWIDTIGTALASGAIACTAYAIPLGVPQAGLLCVTALVLVVRAGVVPSSPE